MSSFLLLLRSPTSTLFPYTTLFRSSLRVRRRGGAALFRRRRGRRCRRREPDRQRSEEHTSELQSRGHLVCRLLLEKKNKKTYFRIGSNIKIIIMFLYYLKCFIIG